MIQGNFKYVYGSTIIYENGTYKAVDEMGNAVLDDRYYGFQKIDPFTDLDESLNNLYYNVTYGAFLKTETGYWIYIDVQGKVASDRNTFYGAGDYVETYKGFPIIGYEKYNHIPCCVIVGEELQAMGYPLSNEK